MGLYASRILSKYTNRTNSQIHLQKNHLIHIMQPEEQNLISIFYQKKL